MEDMEALKPTIFTSVPRLYNRIYDKWDIFSLKQFFLFAL